MSNKTNINKMKKILCWFITICIFLFVSNLTSAQKPAISNLLLQASTPYELTIDSLLCTYDKIGPVVETASAWYKNGSPEMLLYLPFEAGFSNALRDFSGNNHNTTTNDQITNDPVWDRNGGHNGSGAFVFDGNDYLLAGNILPLNSSYTKTAWINCSNYTGSNRNIMSSILHAVNNHFFKVNVDGRLNAGHNLATPLVIDDIAINLNEWYFVAVTFNYSTGEMILYKNGIEVDRGIMPEILRSVIDASVLVGTMNYSWGWAGNIDEPRIYDDVLSAEQIHALYTEGNNLIVPEETAGLDEWYVDVTPFSDRRVGNTYSSNTITITITIHSIIISDIPDQSIWEGSAFSNIILDDYVIDYEYPDNVLTWTAIGNSALTVDIDPGTRIATVTVPYAGWNGSENISFIATNPKSDSDTAAVNFEVINVNDAPVLTEIGNQSTNEGIILTGRTVTFTDPDAGDTHTITVTSDESHVTVANLSGNVSGSTYDLVPAANWNGTAHITVTVTDHSTEPLSDSETYLLTVNAINDAPVLTEIGNQSTNEDTSLVGLAVTFTDPNAGDTHTITVTSNEINVTVASLSGNVSGSTYNLVPAANWNGTANITVTVTDNGTGTLSDNETYTLTVNAINDAPISIELSNNSIDENIEIGTVVGLFSTSDPDIFDSHTYIFASDGGEKDKDNNSFIIVDDTLKTNVEIDFEVKNSFTILVQSDDGNGGTFNQNFIITVNDLYETLINEVNNRFSFNIYPNPADDKLTIEIENPENEKFLLEIVNYVGGVVYSEPIINGKVINVSEFSTGIYFVRFTGYNINIVKKIIINK
jgi:hypothetical protein